MIIWINATAARLGGGITVLRNLLPALTRQDGEQHQYRVVALAEVARALDTGHPRVQFVPFPHKGLGARLFWEQLSLPARTLAGRADVLLSLSNVAVLGSPVPQVLIFQNMAPFDPVVRASASPQGKARFELLRWLGVASAHAVRRVVFISRFAQRSILPQLGAGALQSKCIYLGRDESFSPAAAEQAPQTLSRLGLRQPYLLSVSHFYHYKNFVQLVRGFARARPQLPSDVTLVIAGGEHEADYAAEVRAAIAEEKLGDSVKLLGEVPYQDLPPLYAAAALFVFPSSCENFPNILVEGMASGAPTLASRAGPMQEVARDGATYFDPFDPDDIGRTIVRLYGDRAGRAALSAAGVAQAARYSWDTTAAELLGVLREAAG